MHHPINWSPFATNPIDHISTYHPEEKLATPDGQPVKIENSVAEGFVVWIGEKRIPCGQDNTSCCYFLNINAVGWAK